VRTAAERSLVETLPSGARGGVYDLQRKAESSEVPVVERIQGRDLVVQRRVRQEEIIHLGSAEPAKSLNRSQHLRESIGFGGDQWEHRQVFLDLSENLPVWNTEPGQNGEKFPYGLLSNACPKPSCSDAGPEGKTEVGMVQGGGRGSEEDSSVEERDFVHLDVSLYARVVRSIPGGKSTANRSRAMPGEGAIQRF
jgi:hypothetical protein